ncbi:hypothetical protein [Methylosinus sp. R-45379]|uniref:hypothetical protein n=1 Tax=Methylosinus sp. R-45379 TaxID=980563 RepID=UPI000AEDA8DE|nr:hypothetical protein [Methylosinus sp. R-45379]
MTLEQIEGRRAAVDAALNEAFSRMSKGQTVDSFRALVEERQLCDAAFFEAAYAALDAAQPQ